MVIVVVKINGGNGGVRFTAVTERVVAIYIYAAAQHHLRMAKDS